VPRLWAVVADQADPALPLTEATGHVRLIAPFFACGFCNGVGSTCGRCLHRVVAEEWRRGVGRGCSVQKVHRVRIAHLGRAWAHACGGHAHVCQHPVIDCGRAVVDCGWKGCQRGGVCKAEKKIQLLGAISWHARLTSHGHPRYNNQHCHVRFSQERVVELLRVAVHCVDQRIRVELVHGAKTVLQLPASHQVVLAEWEQ
jgi:hypothetical protein